MCDAIDSVLCSEGDLVELVHPDIIKSFAGVLTLQRCEQLEGFMPG